MMMNALLYLRLLRDPANSDATRVRLGIPYNRQCAYSELGTELVTVTGANPISKESRWNSV